MKFKSWEADTTLMNTSAIPRTAVQNRLGHIEHMVKRIAHEMMPSYRKDAPAAIEAGFFVPIGPRVPVHVITPFRMLQPVLDKLDLPDKTHMADLGSGLGMACFTAAADTRIESIIGYEYDPQVFDRAMWIRDQYEVDKVWFVNFDFLWSPISGFNFIYFYMPFIQRFDEIMSKKLGETLPGTQILSRNHANEKLFSPDRFKPLFAHEAGKEQTFFAFQRI